MPTGWEFVHAAPFQGLSIVATLVKSLGCRFTYGEAARLLVSVVDRRWRWAELIRAGFDAQFVDRVAAMICRNHYKRRMPVIAKLSHRTMDRDFRCARDWGT